MTAKAAGSRWPGLARTMVKIAITLLILGALLARVDLYALEDRMRSIGLDTLAACIGIILVLSLVVALRWHLILSCLSAVLSLAESWRLVMIGLFFNQTLPSGIGGDAVRVWMMVRQGHRLRTAFIGVAADRLFALVAIVVCMVVSLPMLMGGPISLPLLLLSLACVGGCVALFAFDATLAVLGRVWPELAGVNAPKIVIRGIALFRDISRALLQVSLSPVVGPVVLVLSLINQLALGLVVFLIARSLGAEIGLITTMILFPPVMLLSMIPVSFGGWGVREAAIVWLFGTAGVDPETALATSILFGLITTAAGLPGGLFWLVDWLSPKPRTASVVAGPVATPAVVAGPKVLSRKTDIVSPWMRIVEREIEFGDGRIELYHAIEQADYVGILAVTPDGLFPVVRQYRPALERMTCELPAGMVDRGETPESTCVRELQEETGLVARRVHPLGTRAADPARLGNLIHSFLVETEARGDDRGSEPEIAVEYVDLAGLKALVLSGELDLQYHAAIVGMALMRPELGHALSPTVPSREGERLA